MKALGVVHFKGNWTNEKKRLCTLPFVAPFQIHSALPCSNQPTGLTDGQSS